MKQMLFLNMRIWFGINGASQMYQALLSWLTAACRMVSLLFSSDNSSIKLLKR